MRALLAHGMLSWASEERVTDRYGAIYLASGAVNDKYGSKATYNARLAATMIGKRVRLLAKVTASRPSSHVGDLFLKIKPSQPEVGEEIDLGVGIFEEGSLEWQDTPTISLKPSDGREEFWFDPRKLYRLHDQTLDLFIKETEDDFAPVADVRN